MIKTPPPPPVAKPAPKPSALFSDIEDSENGHRVVLYGTGGIGKSTIACLIPGKTAFLDIEASLPILKGQLKAAGIQCPVIVQHDGTFNGVLNSLKAEGWSGVKNIVIDSATKLEELAIAHVLKTIKVGGQAVDGIEDYGYGKGYQYVYDAFIPLLKVLDAHVLDGRNVVLIAHECTTKVPNPAGEDWLRYEPRLQTTSGGKASIRYKVKEWADHVLFLSYDVATDKKSKKGQGTGTRTLYTSEVPAFMAKSRTTNQSFDIQHGVSPWEEILK